MVYRNKGHRETESSKDSTRTNYNARIQFNVGKEGIWTMQKIVLDHNHYLASPNKRHKLKSQGSVQEADMKLICQIREAGMKPAQALFAYTVIYTVYTACKCYSMGTRVDRLAV